MSFLISWWKMTWSDSPVLSKHTVTCTQTACIIIKYKQNISVDADEEVKSPSTHTPHLPITVATLMKILKRAELVRRLCIAMAMQTGRNPFFIERHCRFGYSECSACDIKRKGEPGGGKQTHSNSLTEKAPRWCLKRFYFSLVWDSWPVQLTICCRG